MFKLVVLFALAAVAVAKPHGATVALPLVAHSYIASAPVSYVAAAPVVAQTYIAPAAVSSTYREDIISKPAAVVAPVETKEEVISEPVVVEAKAAIVEPTTVAPVETTTAEVKAKAVEAEALEVEAVAAPAAVSSSYREDIISKPAAVAYSLPVVQNTIAYAAPVAYHAAPVAYHAVPTFQAWWEWRSDFFVLCWIIGIKINKSTGCSGTICFLQVPVFIGLYCYNCSGMFFLKPVENQAM